MNEKFNKALYMALSLLIAIVFWIFVDSEQGNTTEAKFTGIPVEFIGETDTLPSRGLMLTEGGDTTIDLTLKGPRLVISDLKREDVRVEVSLININGVGTYTLDYKIRLPDDIARGSVSTESASRSAVTVQVSELFSRTIPVQAEVVGQVGEGYIYQSKLLALEPSTITISGREEDVIQVDRARITVDLEGATATIQQDFGYELLDSEGNVIENEDIRLSNKQISVYAPVYMVKTLALTVKFKESPGSRLEDVDVTQGYTTIDVAGEAASLENKEDILLGEVDLSAYQSDAEVSFDIMLPAGCENLSGITSTTVSLKFLDTVATRAFTVTDISAIGLSEGQTFSRMTSAVDVVVRGPAEELEKITEENIRIVVDLTQYADNGTYYEPGIVLVDGSDKVGAVGGPYMVYCKITS